MAPNGGVEATFGEGHREAAFGAVVRRLDQTVTDGADDEALQRPFAARSSAGGVPGHGVVQDCQIFAAAQLASIIAQEHDTRTVGFETAGDGVRRVLEQPDDAEHRCRIDRFAVGFVVEADIAAGDRESRAPGRRRRCREWPRRAAT